LFYSSAVAALKQSRAVLKFGNGEMERREPEMLITDAPPEAVSFRYRNDLMGTGDGEIWLLRRRSTCQNRKKIPIGRQGHFRPVTNTNLNRASIK
jgi:hypothetical protein